MADRPPHGSRLSKVTTMDEYNKNRSRQPDAADFERDQANRDGKRRRDEDAKQKLDEALDRGLEESFPGSDPVSVTQPPHSVYDKPKR
jgi:hypothetical protein